MLNEIRCSTLCFGRKINTRRNGYGGRGEETVNCRLIHNIRASIEIKARVLDVNMLRAARAVQSVYHLVAGKVRNKQGIFSPAQEEGVRTVMRF